MSRIGRDFSYSITVESVVLFRISSASELLNSWGLCIHGVI